MQHTILLAIQSIANPVLDVVFTVFSILGEPIVAALIISFVYWLWDKEIGEYLAFAVLGSLCVNGLVKNLVNAQRPIGREGIRTLYEKTATGASFPSGHSQNAAAVCGAFAWRRRSLLASLAVLIPSVFIGFSRLYLGLHWPLDVLAGLALGLLCSAGSYVLFCAVQERGRELVYLGATALFLTPAILWGDSDFIKGYGMLAGFTLGVLLEHRLVGFSTDGSRRRKLLRWLAGLALLGLVKLGLGAILPQSLLSDGIIYGAVAFSVFFFCPLLFRLLRL